MVLRKSSEKRIAEHFERIFEKILGATHLRFPRAILEKSPTQILEKDAGNFPGKKHLAENFEKIPIKMLRGTVSRITGTITKILSEEILGRILVEISEKYPRKKNLEKFQKISLAE